MDRLKNSILILICAAPCWAAEKPAAPAFQPPPMANYWLKVYTFSPYIEHWTISLKVADLGKDLPKLRDIFMQAGGALTAPFESFPASKTMKSQQLSYKLSKKASAHVVEKLKKVAEFPAPMVQPSVDLVPLAEVRDKIAKLTADKKAHAKELAQMPAVSAMADELLEHLLMIESVREREPDILINITIQQK